MERIQKILASCGIVDSAPIKYSDCRVINPRLASRLDFEPKSVCIGLLPYYTKYCDSPRSVSAYALAYDYHKLIDALAQRVLQIAKETIPDSHFAVFGDHSPIDEKDAAAKAGLGIIGTHSLLITPKYSSFVFLFELITDIECDADPKEIKHCENCGLCTLACPTFLAGNGMCVSAISQKKGDLNLFEANAILKARTVWGCDICQLACPHTKKAIENKTIYTNIDWFTQNVLPYPTEETVDSADFEMRAYAWRGKSTILRNISLMNQIKDKK